MTALPRPSLDAINAPYWRSLEEGRLRFQRCAQCAQAWLPPRAECPRCLAGEPLWEDAEGTASLVSWVTYRRALHPAFEARLPYVVALVELDEGPRLMTNLVGLPAGATPAAGMRLRLRIEHEDGLTLARFAPAP
jgi:uncharacterized OB-fold protein